MRTAWKFRGRIAYLWCCCALVLFSFFVVGFAIPCSAIFSAMCWLGYINTTIAVDDLRAHASLLWVLGVIFVLCVTYLTSHWYVIRLPVWLARDS